MAYSFWPNGLRKVTGDASGYGVHCDVWTDSVISIGAGRGGRAILNEGRRRLASSSSLEV